MKIQSRKNPANIQELTAEQWESMPVHMKKNFIVIESGAVVIKRATNTPSLKVETVKQNPLLKKTIK
jgi:hypothetical protein